MNTQIPLKFVALIGLIALAVGFFAGQESLKYKLRKEFQETFSNDFNLEDDSDDTEAGEEETIINKKLGETIELATIDVTVNSWNEKSSIPVDFGTPIVPSDGAKLIAVNVTILNKTDSEIYMLGSDWSMLENEQGKSFGEHEEGYELEDYISYETIKPDIPVTGNVLFEVSNSSTKLYLIVLKANTNEKYKIELSN